METKTPRPERRINPDELAVRTNVTLSRQDKAQAKSIGKGNVSAGIRKALEFYDESHALFVVKESNR